MSRIGKNSVAIPSGVEISVAADHVEVKGKNGTLRHHILPDVTVKTEDGEVVVTPNSNSKQARALWGTTRANIQTMVTGVTEGFKRELEIQGVGYRAQMQGKTLKLQLGYSHDVEFPVPEGITIECPSQTEVIVSGTDKQRVGQVASNIRGWRPPEPYKGKGIRYKDEYVLRKEGKKK
ncbi:MAG: 50S ribosomal protein L6 [Rhodospirillaceae bacterium]|nr:50S ribosomal protein L6 [Rhodospirillaceae bacterium]|tara:strand:+ start:5107 stop:5640 length:534 start_codon:yes stop_codon:yes gene_type:complete